MNFSNALEHLKTGSKVARTGWNGKGMFLQLVFDYQWMAPVMLGYQASSWIGMKTADGSFVPWTASQTDLLANDWILIV